MRFTKAEILERLNRVVEEGHCIIAAGAGGGLSAKAEEKGGADLILVYNSGRFRMAGRSSLAGILPIGDANRIAVEIALEAIPIIKDTPVVAGVFAQDPFIDIEVHLSLLLNHGIAGVQNAPSFGQWDGRFKQDMEEAGFSFRSEVTMIEQANELGLLTIPSAWSAEQAMELAPFSDLLVVHLGATASTPNELHTGALDAAAKQVQSIHDAAYSVNKDVLVLCHGGPIAEPEDLEYIINHTTGIVGFQGGSSMERLPVERAIAEQVQRFKKVTG